MPPKKGAPPLLSVRRGSKLRASPPGCPAIRLADHCPARSRRAGRDRLCGERQLRLVPHTPCPGCPQGHAAGARPASALRNRRARRPVLPHRPSLLGRRRRTPRLRRPPGFGDGDRRNEERRPDVASTTRRWWERAAIERGVVPHAGRLHRRGIKRWVASRQWRRPGDHQRGRDVGSRVHANRRPHRDVRLVFVGDTVPCHSERRLVGLVSDQHQFRSGVAARRQPSFPLRGQRRPFVQSARPVPRGRVCADRHRDG